MLWTIAKNDAERRKILQNIYEFEEYAERIVSNELLEICDDLPNLPLYFDVWLNILCKLDTTFSYPNAFPKQWEEFEKLPDEWQELWCNAIDRASGLYVEVSFAIKGFVSTYNITPKREIPKALRVAFEAAGEKITDDVVQQPTKERKKPQRTFRELIQHPDADEVLGRLHYLIDGKSGCKVGYTIRKAWLDKLIIAFPTLEEFQSEFELICESSNKKAKWEAIRKYFDRENTGYDIKANDIKILD